MLEISLVQKTQEGSAWSREKQTLRNRVQNTIQYKLSIF
jgi:hypothetical protein